MVTGQRLREIRKGKGITQDELAELLKVRKTTISAYENDKIDPVDNSKVQIAKFFNITLDYLLGVIDKPIPYFNERMILLPEHTQEKHKEFIEEYIRFVSYYVHK